MQSIIPSATSDYQNSAIFKFISFIAKIIPWPNGRPPRINDRINNTQVESTERVENSYPSHPSCSRETREKANESSRNQLTGRQVFDYGRGIGRAAIKLEINLTSS